MPKSPRLLLAPLALALSLALLSGCGAAGDTVAQIEGTSASIARPTLNHWMRAMAGGDFHASLGGDGPQGLVSEPANYPECVAAAKKIVPRTDAGQLKLNNAQILRKCRELHRALKTQALTFLISVQWSIVEGAAQGIKVSDAQLRRKFAHYRKDFYPTEQALQKYMAERHWVLSDVLYQLKRNVLTTAILPKFEQKVKQAGGGELLYAKLALQRLSVQSSKTSCSPGYVVYHCKGYRPATTEPPSPNAILEQFVQGDGS